MNAPELQFILDNKYKAAPKYIKFHWPEFFNYLQSTFDGLKFSEQLYRYYFGAPDPCPICGNLTKYINITKGYTKYCSCKCAANDPHVKSGKKSTNPRKKQRPYTPEEITQISAKRHQTNIEKYGESYNELFKSRRQQTNIERYGVDEFFKTDKFKHQSESTCLQKYGVKVAAQSDNIRSKISRSNKRTQNLQEIKSKIRATNIERYGVEVPAQNPVIQQKIKQTTIDRYGGMGMAAPSIRAKIQSTNLDKYGYGCYQAFVATCNHDFLLKNNNGEWTCRCPHPNCTQCSEHSFITTSQHYWARKAIGVEQCTKLLPIKAKTSTLEFFIKDILDDYNIKYIQQDSSLISPKSVDFYLPDYKIVIECNGCYWHSTKFKEPSTHIDRYKKLANIGVQCITLWEDWIMNTPDIVKSIILSKLGITERIYARKCCCREVDKKLGNQFLNKNHIQGNAKSTVMYGLYHNEELVALMTFLKTSDGVWGLERFCNKINYTVVGGASKILNHFIKTHNPTNIYSFSSCDISDGKLYKKLGFQSTNKISKSYWYIDLKLMKRYHRKNFSKDSIVKKGLRPNKIGWSERDVINELELTTIYDSGMIRWDLFLN